MNAHEASYRDLERAVEELSELIESPLDPDTIATLRQKVTDKTVSGKFCFDERKLTNHWLPGLCAEAKRDCSRGYCEGLPRRSLEVELQCRWFRLIACGPLSHTLSPSLLLVFHRL